MLKHTQEQQYKTDLFKEVDKKFWQVIEKEKLLFEINNKKKRKNKNNRVN
jgi:hypothetical protein